MLPAVDKEGSKGFSILRISQNQVGFSVGSEKCAFYTRYVILVGVASVVGPVITTVTHGYLFRFQLGRSIAVAGVFLRM